MKNFMKKATAVAFSTAILLGSTSAVSANTLTNNIYTSITTFDDARTPEFMDSVDLSKVTELSEFKDEFNTIFYSENLAVSVITYNNDETYNSISSFDELASVTKAYGIGAAIEVMSQPTVEEEAAMVALTSALNINFESCTTLAEEAVVVGEYTNNNFSATTEIYAEKCEDFTYTPAQQTPAPKPETKPESSNTTDTSNGQSLANTGL